MKPCTTRINALLKKAGLGLRLVRGRGGYYYLHGEESGRLSYSSVLSYRLEPEDFDWVRVQINDILSDASLATI